MGFSSVKGRKPASGEDLPADPPGSGELRPEFRVIDPIHWDDEIAKVVGLDTAIAHGMLTMKSAVATSHPGLTGAITEYNDAFAAVVRCPMTTGAELVNGGVK